MKKANYVHQAPDFLTDEELRQLEAFDLELEIFDEQISILTVTVAEKRHMSAVEAYLAAPSHENFSAFRQAAIEVVLIEREVTPSSVAAVVEGARETVIKNKIAPWSQAILRRALAEAQRRLEEITAEESKRHKELTGEAIAHSGIVEAAKRPVIELERLLAATKSPANYRCSIFPYLRAHRAVELS